ncbi:PTS sugar transporter subunit IIA [Aliagarivorans taiwanensis]|uniref:PTS sugar transporter subunit IIA n=1 Tax=Aliagarivorans taiwanensis TaxID=561966 RepID=UPI0003FE4DF2|nr:PTS sugar transporter subunit IIA [Aliagarivorans taiwanensis]
MKLRSIDFMLGEQALPIQALGELRKLCGYFRSVVVLYNLSRRKRGDAQHRLQLLSVGSQPWDICQLQIEGPDSELAEMVLTEFINEHFCLLRCLRRSFIGEPKAPALPTTLTPPFELQFHYHRYRQDALYQNKATILATASKLITANFPSKLLQEFEKRESVSATVMGNGIALPHVINEWVPQPALAVIPLPQACDWGSRLGPVSLILALSLPKRPSREMVQAFARLSKATLVPAFCQQLLTCDSPLLLQALLRRTLISD